MPMGSGVEHADGEVDGEIWRESGKHSAKRKVGRVER